MAYDEDSWLNFPTEYRSHYYGYDDSDFDDEDPKENN